ncbi:MAG: phosphoenolpyruvate carboxykinase, partial [Enterococcus aquimarinus]|nr:phosphoenolpyruvate carboxykinase [Enterococcus aquimarinus]
MSTIKQFNRTAIKKNHPLLSSIKSIIETAFYGNNVVPISLVSDAYHLARKSPSVIVTDLPVEGALALDLPEDAKILVHNDGAIVGRTAAARRVIGQPG